MGTPGNSVNLKNFPLHISKRLNLFVYLRLHSLFEKQTPNIYIILCANVFQETYDPYKIFLKVICAKILGTKERKNMFSFLSFTSRDFPVFILFSFVSSDRLFQDYGRNQLVILF